jgi:diacylglycerol kinase
MFEPVEIFTRFSSVSMRKYFISLGNSFRAATRGCLQTFVSERTFQVMIAAALFLFVLMSVLPLSETERLVLLLVMGMVLVLELMNTMVERLVDLLKPRLSSYVREVKDLMAAAVLVGSLFALLIGGLILCPYLAALVLQL